MILYRAMTAINKKAWGAWMSLFRKPKRLFTTFITLDPGFMAANFARDTAAAFVLSRDNFIPVAGAIKGFKEVLMKDESYRTMLGAGAAFENGYITAGDPTNTRKILKRAMRDRSFTATVLDTPMKLFQAYKALGSAIENANRVAVYNAAIAAGKGKARAAYEAKDLMDFSMGGDWPVIQFLIQTVPFVGARMQGLHRMGRGFVENPISFSIKGMLIGMAGLALWFAFRDDDRYKELEEWDKDTYFHWWVGDNHFRLPKPFEIGAIFNTIPERMFEFIYSQENDAGKLLLRRWAFMLHETFAVSPLPQTVQPIVEGAFNYNFFTGRSIVSPYEEQRLPPEQYRYTTSPTMTEIARWLPSELDTVSKKIRSPLHLQNLWQGYTGTLGRYFLMASDAMVRSALDYPLPPTRDISRMPVVGRFYRGDAPLRTKYEQEVYDLIRKTTAIQGSLAFLEKTGQLERYISTHEDELAYIKAAGPLEDIRENVQDINRAQMQIWMDPEMDPDEKKGFIDELQKSKNYLMEEGWKLRPGGEYNPENPEVTNEEIMDMIENFGKDDSEAHAMRLREEAPDTYELLTMVDDVMSKRNLASLAKVNE
jgi:hypothetical protein